MKTNSKPNVRLVIFDLDGTLVDAFHAIADSINYMMKKMGRKPKSFLTIKRAVGWGVDSLVRTFIEEEHADKALLIFREHHDKRLRQNIHLLPGVRTLLPYLKKQGCVLAIASNRPTRFCRIILEQLSIDHYFDYVICGDAVKRPKPHPDMLLEIMKKSRIKPVQTVYVGDMIVDVGAAKAAGVLSVAVRTGTCTRKELEGSAPDHLIPRISLLKETLEF